MVSRRVISERPPNEGIDVSALDGYSMSQQQMFVRCNFPVPAVLPHELRIVMPDRPGRQVSVATLSNYQAVEIDMVLECAGNGRILMDPVPEGTPWDLGAASPITIGGVKLADVLGSIPDSVVDLVFTGADGYQFSLDRQTALSRRPVLATHIGDEPLDRHHGAPMRLLVPGQYAMKSVKWLVTIEGIPFPFRGHFVEKYRYYRDTTEPEETPVGAIAVRSVISSPRNGEMLNIGEIDIRGSAWSGSGYVDSVEVSVDGGESWAPADVVVREVGGTFAAVRWALTVSVEPGSVEIMARATDSTGETQPLEARWNANGYANNVIHRIDVEVH